MEYQILKPGDTGYPARLKKRLAGEAPALHYHGPLDLLHRWTMGVISADSSTGVAMVAMNQLLFTIREYEINYIGSWHSVLETEIFRHGLFRKYTTVTLFSAKGLGKETFDSFLLDRFYPPLHDFPERDEYFERAESGKLLILSIVPPDVGRTLRTNVVARNWVSCNLADTVFIPFAAKRSKTYAMAKRILAAGVPCFTSDDPENRELHRLGVPGFSRKSVGPYLDSLGARRPAPAASDPVQVPLISIPAPPSSRVASPPKRPRQAALFQSK